MIGGMSDARSVLERCDALARCTEEPGRITRRFATPALAEARDLVAGWMREAGLEPRVDAVGNLFGRREGSGRTLLLGSHLDSVRDAGRYDGPLGIIVALAAAQRMKGRPLPFALEVAAFADEEGARYQTAYLGSAVVAGRFEGTWLDRPDADGISMGDALTAAGGDPDAAAGALPRSDLMGYAEVHIEQGPMLEDAGLPVAVVTAIAGQTRSRLTFRGEAAHAGTTPMAGRRDALAAAAQWIGAVEATGRAMPGLRATVGYIEALPGSPNVVPSIVTVTLDVRHAVDTRRWEAVGALRARAEEIAAARGVRCDYDELQATDAVPCDAALTDQLGAAAAQVTGSTVLALPSGAGHDAVMLSAVTPVAMLFVRCPGGTSHHPDETVREADVGVALDVLTRFLEQAAG